MNGLGSAVDIAMDGKDVVSGSGVIRSRLCI